MIARLLSMLGVVAAFGAASASAQSERDQNWQKCVNDGGTFAPDVAVGGCTAIAESGEETTEALAAAFHFRGRIHSEQGRPDAAIADYDVALKLNPEFAAAFHDRASAHGEMGQLDQAIQDYDQAIRIEPTLASAFQNRGAAYFTKGDYERALQDFDQAIRLSPDDATTWSSRCFAKALQGRATQALPDCEQSLKLRPDDAYALNSRALVHLQLRNLAAASADSAAAVKGQSGIAAWHYLFSLILAAQGNRAAADAQVEEAKKASEPAQFEQIRNEFDRFRPK